MQANLLRLEQQPYLTMLVTHSALQVTAGTPSGGKVCRRYDSKRGRCFLQF